MKDRPADGESDFSRRMAEARVPLLAKYCDKLASIPLPINVIECRCTIKFEYDDGFTAVIEATVEAKLSVKRRRWWQWGRR